MKNKNIILILLCILINSIYTDIQAQWPQWRGIDRDGISHEDKLLKDWPTGGPKRLWAVNTVGLGFASATVNDNVIYTTGKIDSMEVATALDMNGVVIWQKIFGRAHKGEYPDSRATPTFYKNMIYVLSGYGDLACIDAKNGNMIWQLQGVEKLGAKGNDIWGISENVLVVDDKVIYTVGSKQTALIAVDYLKGETIWKTESLNDASEYFNPVLIEAKDKKIVVSGTRNYTFAVNIADGKIIWKEKRGFGYVPLVINKTKFFIAGFRYQEMFSYDYDKNNFSILWSDSINNESSNAQVVINDKMYGVSQTGFFCYDINTGKILFTDSRVKNSSIIATKDRLYTYNSQNGKIFLLKTIDNKVEIAGQFRVTIGGGSYYAHLSIGNGILFVRHGTFLIAYDIKEK